MGIVFLAEDTRLHRKVAIKAMLPEFARDTKARERFLREARHAANIRHDNVVTVFQVDEHEDVPYIAMELLPGMSLEQRLQATPVLPLPEIVRISREIAQGLAAAHSAGIIHRDIKPGNILLEAPTGRVKLLDFGLARPVEDTNRITRAGLVLGTPSYMSPEQAAGKVVDHRSDLFSLGIVLYRMCTGIDPFERDSIMAVLTALAVETPAPLRTVNPTIPPEIERIVQGLLEKQVSRRYQSAPEVIADLEQAASALAPQSGPRPSWSVEPSPSVGHSGGVVRSSPPSHSSPSPSSRRWGLVAAFICFLVLALGVGLWFVLSGNTIVPGEPGEKDIGPGSVKELKGEERKGETGDKDGSTSKTAPKEDITGKEDAKKEPAKGQEYTNSIGMAFVRVGPGKFTMGSPPTEPGRRGSEHPHTVSITRPFYMGKYEVTQAQFEKVMGYNPSSYRLGGREQAKVAGKDTGNYPVETVTWEEAAEFCEKLSKLEACQYSLPTEARWEYACRAGTKTPYAFGMSLSKKDANFNFYYNVPLPVGSLRPNAWGIHDMHGNAREWVVDYFDEHFYKVSSPVDPTGPTEGGKRVLRGASWANGPDGARSAFRDAHVPGARSTDFGFRVTLKIE